MMKKSNTLSQLLLITFFLMITSMQSRAQDIGIGEWRDHLPYNRTVAVTEVGEKIYAATPYSLFYYNKSDNSVQRLTKISGLSDVGISTIRYNEYNESILIAYSNTNLDVIKGNTIINISDIERKSILGNKTINNIMFIDQYAYLSCGFGIVVLDTDREEIHDTYYIGPQGNKINVMDMTYDRENGLLYAATAQGIYSASIDHPNLANFEAWHKDTVINEPNETYNLITYYNNKVYVNKEGDVYNTDTVLIQQGDAWGYSDQINNRPKRSMRVKHGKLVISAFGFVDLYDKNDNRTLHLYRYEEGQPVDANDAIVDKDENVWIADRDYGMVKNWDNAWTFEKIIPNGPTDPDIFTMDAAGKEIWVAPGGRNVSWINNYKEGMIHRFTEGSWNTFDKNNLPALDTVRDVITVAVDPADKSHVFVGTWGYDLFEFSEGELVTIYNEENSTLQSHVLREDWLATGGLEFDSEGNLWVTNSSAPDILSAREPDGTWHSFNLGSSYSGIEAGELVIDDYGQQWILLRDHGLLVFNHNNTLENSADDYVRKLTGNAGNGNLPGALILSHAVDQDGELWVGTDEGVAVVYSPGNVFTGGNYDAQRILVEQDGYVQYLLETEAVTCITVDGANKKWFGTDRAGVFYMSEDGTEEIHHFTTENSPLLSNSITDIAITEDGEVFFGTAEGIISYKSVATTPPPTFEEVYAYPNPVRSGYNGTIAIRGLVRNADVKITDISGNVVYETVAEGGQAVWDGKNLDGKRVSTGVYLIFTSNNDGSETLATKLLMFK
ncbi:MAG: T9SS type A sorting domain-containing protein [Bacteroidales bacterium]|nr:T9SS type A sorting domain-containing protein [Bacteroidales bacterium]